MTDVAEQPVVQAVLAIAVLIVLVSAAFWLLARFRDYAACDRQEAQEVLANLREMHLRGDITAEEFRTIQASTQRLPDGVSTNAVSNASQATNTRDLLPADSDNPKPSGHTSS